MCGRRQRGLVWALGLVSAACSAADGGAGRARLEGSAGSGGAAASAGSAGTAGTAGFDNSTGGQSPVPVPPRDAGLVARDGGSCNQDVDIVFTLDVSGSMIPPLTRLEAEVDKVDAALQAKNLPGPPHYGLVIFVDDVAVLNGGAPYADVAQLRAAITAEIMTTNLAPARQAAPGGALNFDWPENSLDALHAAATQFQWRDAASTLRTIIHITDASFRDLTSVSSAAGDPMNLEQGNGTLSSMRSFDETIEALRAQSIWVNTFAARTGGPPGLTPSPPSHGAFRGVDVNVGIGFFEPYDGRNSIADSTGGLAWDIDQVYDGIISLATPINEAVEDRQCTTYPPPPPPPD
jgi:hypothetical protein